MKKFLLMIALAFTPMLIIAQNQHIQFKGIPVDGNINEFVDKMKRGGFTLKELDGHMATMKGEFVNKNCEVYVVATPKTNIVWKVSVYLPKETSWYSIESSYQSFKDNFKAKYGAPTKSYEFFSSPYYKGDGYEMQALRNEKCRYLTYWDLPEGTIIVSISKFEQITFSYEDNINSEKMSQEKNTNVMGDI